MIPADVASRLKLITPDQPAAAQPAAPARQLTDVLSELVPGQRLQAEIMALLPNGTYRAVIAQRDVTLALPFSAKPGDALELEVVESDGKLTLAFVANRGAGGQQAGANEAVSTTLSRTGQLIGDLLGNIDEGGKKSAPLALNGNQPLVEEFPKSGAELAPILKQALSQSGMFYEAHQARWVEGNLPTAALLQEPQGKLSAQARHDAAALTPGNLNPQATEAGRETGAPANTANADAALAQKNPAQNPVSPDLAPLVRHQLDALANQTFVWQGQVWPGQQMHWEIQEEPDGRRQASDDAPPEQWQTRLRLNLPSLGGIDAVMRLRPGGAIDIAVATDSENSRQALAAAGESLRQQLESAGLSLSAMTIRHDETAP